MRQKQFGRFVCLFLVVVLAIATVTRVSAAPRPPVAEVRGVWLTNVDSEVLFSRRALAKGIARLADLNFNTIYPTVWQSGYTLFPSKVAEKTYGVAVDPEPGFVGRDMLAEAIDLGHRRGMTVIPWFEFGFLSTAQSELSQLHPEWLTQRADGTQIEEKGNKQLVWLNPFRPEVQDFLLEMVVEVVEKYDVDGIQFDDHFGLPADFGYDSWTLERFNASLGGIELTPDNLERHWRRWRLDRLSEFVERLHEAVKAVKPDCIISLSPNPFLFAHTRFLQDWFNWQQSGWVDELVLQVYREDMAAFSRELSQRELDLVRRKTPVVVGILTGLRNRSMPIETIEAQVRESRRLGFAGVSYFFYESLWEWSREPRWQRDWRLRELFATPVSRRPIRASNNGRGARVFSEE